LLHSAQAVSKTETLLKGCSERIAPAEPGEHQGRRGSCQAATAQIKMGLCSRAKPYKQHLRPLGGRSGRRESQCT